jgi:hypothetical protein
VLAEREDTSGPSLVGYDASQAGPACPTCEAVGNCGRQDSASTDGTEGARERPRPKCEHGEFCLLQQVKKTSANRGRFFFSCYLPFGRGRGSRPGMTRCSFFQWADECGFVSDPTLTARLDSMFQDVGHTATVELNKAQVRVVRLTVRRGMKGRFVLLSKEAIGASATSSETLSSAHLMFERSDGAVLAFLDRRPRTTHAALWHEGLWGPVLQRGPDPVSQYSEFRQNILSSLTTEDHVWGRPICEVLLDQRFFNGVGNYVRAELLWAAKVPPFVSARSVLAPLLHPARDNGPPKAKAPDLLSHVRDILCKSVLASSASKGNAGIKTWLSVFRRRYSHREVDSLGRTIWYRGERGPMSGPQIVTSPWETLVFRGLPANLSHAGLCLLLKACGDVARVTHNVPKGYAFVRFAETEQATRALKALSQMPMLAHTQIAFKSRFRPAQNEPQEHGPQSAAAQDGRACARDRGADAESVDGVLKEVVEDEEEDDEERMEEIDEPMVGGGGRGRGWGEDVVAGAGGRGGPGKRRREGNWAETHACVGVGGSLHASLRGFRSLGRMQRTVAASSPEIAYSAREGSSGRGGASPPEPIEDARSRLANDQHNVATSHTGGSIESAGASHTRRTGASQTLTDVLNALNRSSQARD